MRPPTPTPTPTPRPPLCPLYQSCPLSPVPCPLSSALCCAVYCDVLYCAVYCDVLCCARCTVLRGGAALHYMYRNVMRSAVAYMCAARGCLEVPTGAPPSMPHPLTRTHCSRLMSSSVNFGRLAPPLGLVGRVVGLARGPRARGRRVRPPRMAGGTSPVPVLAWRVVLARACQNLRFSALSSVSRGSPGARWGTPLGP